MKKLQLLLISIIIVTSASAQHADRSKFIKDSLDNYINRAMTGWRIPGVAVCIVRDNKVVMMKGYGIKELGLNNKVDENTLFMIGSNTKAFTATALAMLQTEGKLSLDDKVTKYLPQWKLEDPLATQMAIVRDLLCHRIGFRTFQGDFTFYNTDLTRDQVMEKMSHVHAAYPFRTKWGYTNSAFLTAGQIIPVVTGKPWETFVREHIFAPLGMGNTVALTADITKSLNRTVPHTLVNGQLTTIPYCQIDGLAPAGAISSSANDMSKWVLALLNEGKVGQRQVIPWAAIQATRQAQDIVGSNTHPDGETDYVLYGLGFEIEDYHNHRIIMHTGGVNGYLSSVTLVPKDHLGIIVLTNTDQNDFFEALKWEIMDAYFGRPFSDYSGKYLTYFKSQQDAEKAKDKKLHDTIAMNPQPALPPSAYVGKYNNDLYGNMTVTQGANNDLEMRFEHHTRMYAKLQPLGGNRFYVTFSDPILGKAIFPFTAKDGKVTGVRVKVADFVEYDPYDFVKQ
ncbi:MAG TPA: serine hydrolase [Mucilaginibacter sp.]|jgi:CubicO group peptidase (beta-lactamase class C family)|nr:serine hydrolase [Mucilaginibacter sp.]